jgi:hypothetical protein
VLHLLDDFRKRIPMLSSQRGVMTALHPFVRGHAHKSYSSRLQHPSYFAESKIIGARAGQLNQNVKAGNQVKR